MTLGPGSWVDGDYNTFFFIAELVAERGANRNPPRKRPFRTGAKLDHTGCEPDEYTLDLSYNPDVSEGDVDAVWPGDVETIIVSFKTGKTGTLNLPWKRGIRCKPDSWDRVESASENRGGAKLRVKFTEDNEDSLDRQAVQLVTVKATVQSQVEATQFDMESEGMDLFAIEDITELAADIVGLLNFPGDVAGALYHAGNRLRRACDTVLAGVEDLADPRGANASMKLLEMKELGARAVGEGRPKPTRTITFQKMRDIWTIAQELVPPQNARELMTINEQIEDFAVIPAGTPVRVFV